jgi:hypothetical protein
VRQPLSTLYLLQAAGFFITPNSLAGENVYAVDKDTKNRPLQALFIKK